MHEICSEVYIENNFSEIYVSITFWIKYTMDNISEIQWN